MTEADWLACEQPLRLLEYPAVQADARKLRLFACAYWQRLARRLKDERCREEVAVARRFADGLANAEELADAHASVEAFLQRLSPREAEGDTASPQAASQAGTDTQQAWPLARAAHAATEAEAHRAAVSAVISAPWFGTGDVGSAGDAPPKDSATPTTFMDTLEKLWVSIKTVGASLLARGPEHRAQAELLRHIFGNPFRPATTPVQWPATVRQLAASLHEGSECAFALHDALLEAGYNDLADHFRESEHPPGCWVLDSMLEK
jgi:hypothetical protein